MLMLLALATFGLLCGASYRRYTHQVRQLSPAAGAAASAQLNAAEPREELTFATLEIGDIVVDDNQDTDWLIIGTLSCQEEDESWNRHIVTDGVDERWFHVFGPRLTLAAFMPEVHDFPQHGSLSSQVSYAGDHYRLLSRGEARLQATGEVQDDFPTQVLYVRYKGNTGNVLYIEESDGGRRVWHGRESRPDSVHLMAGRPPDEDLMAGLERD